MSKEMHVLDGVMLGDGCLRRFANGAYLHMNLSKTSKDGRLTMDDNVAWLGYIKNECLIPLGVEVSDIYPKLRWRHSKIRSYQMADLTSRQSDFLIEQHSRWYAQTGEWIQNNGHWYRRGDTKIVPRDFILNPVILAHWFVGDGGSHRPNTSPSATMVSLATCCFTRLEVLQLTVMLNKMGIITNKPNRLPTEKGSGMVILIAQDSVDDFFDIIAPHMPSHVGLIQYIKENRVQPAGVKLGYTIPDPC